MMASLLHAAGSAVDGILAFVSAFWWLLLLSRVRHAIGAFFEGVRDFLLALVMRAAEVGERRHQRRLEIIRARRGDRLPVGVREDGSLATVAPAGPQPGPCPHRPRNIRAVIGVDGELKSWLCEACGDQLPATFAVLAEDL